MFNDSHRVEFDSTDQFLLRFLPVLAVGLLILSGCRDEPATMSEVEDPPANTVADINANAPKNAKLPTKSNAVRSSGTVADSDWFVEVSESCGLKAAYSDGSEAGAFQLIESVGGGIAVLDYDRDGDLDVFVSGGGQIDTVGELSIVGRPCFLFRNRGDGSFDDVSESAGLADVAWFYSHGVTVGDANNDGFDDLFCAGYNGACLLLNVDGSRFIDATSQSSISTAGWNVSGTFADYDHDGLLDLYVLTYADWSPDSFHKCINDQRLRDICGPTHYEGSLDRLLRNTGDGRFEDVTASVGIGPANRGLGVLAADLNNDRQIDFYVANDVQENQLYLSDGAGGFESDALLMGVALSADGQRQGSMGIASDDIDRDGDLDLFYTNYATEDNSLMQSTPNGFIDQTMTQSLAGRSRPWVGFGTVLADFNSDNWPDLLIANGHVAYDRKDGPYEQPAQLFRNESGEKFVELIDQAGPYFAASHVGRGIAIGDLNGDGAIDALISHQTEPVAVLRNQHSPEDSMRIRLVGVDSNRDAVGAKCTIEPTRPDDSPLTRWVLGGGSYLSQSDRTIVIPRIDDSLGRVTVRIDWPRGLSERFENLEWGGNHVVVESTGELLSD